MFFRLQMFDLDSDKELFLIKLPNEVKLTIISQLFVYNYIIKQLIKYQKKFNNTNFLNKFIVYLFIIQVIFT